MVEKIPWRMKWQPGPVFMPEKFHGQRSLGGYNPWGRKELGETEHKQKPEMFKIPLNLNILQDRSVGGYYLDCPLCRSVRYHSL